MRVLVTGGAGYVGGFTARHLLALGHEVRALDDLSTGHGASLPPGRLVEGSIADGALVRRVLERDRIEAVVHFAASAAVAESVAKPRRYWRNNVAGTLALLEAMLEAGVRRIVFSSTCAVYAERREMPLREDAPIGPESPYAFTKHAIEQMIRDLARADGLRFALLRYFNAAGASADGAHGEDHDPESHLIPRALRCALGREDGLRVFGDDYPTPDGTCVRDYVHVEDLAAAHVLALERTASREGGEVFNLGTGAGHSVLEVIRAAERVAGRRVPCEIAPRRPGDSPALVASADRARGELGWEPRHGLDAILRSAWAWHSAHPEGYADGR